MLQAGEKVQDRYEVLSLVGEGGLAQVYKVRHLRLGSVHALKLLSWHRQGLARRLLLEGRIQAQLRHPNVVAVTDIIEYGGRMGLLMEYVDHLPLPELVRRPGRLSIKEALGLFTQVLAGVAAAHAAGVLHRDLKPQNILLARTAHGLMPKVSDFGIAKVILEEERAGRTMTGMPMGTPGYMAPEQVLNSAGVDERADVFSLGAILFEMLAGETAFVDPDGQVTVGTTINLPPRRLEDHAPNLPDHVIQATYKALEKDREDRFPTVLAFARVLLVDHPDLLSVVEGQRHPEVVTISPELRTPVPPGLGPKLNTSDSGVRRHSPTWNLDAMSSQTIAPPVEDLPPVSAPPVRVSSTPVPMSHSMSPSNQGHGNQGHGSQGHSYNFLSTQHTDQGVPTQVNVLGPWLVFSVIGLLLVGFGMGYLLWGDRIDPDPVPTSVATTEVAAAAPQPQPIQAPEPIEPAAQPDPGVQTGPETEPETETKTETVAAREPATQPAPRPSVQPPPQEPPAETAPAEAAPAEEPTPEPIEEPADAVVEVEPDASPAPPEPTAAPAVEIPALKGDWSGDAAGRPLRLYITSQDGRELQAKVTFILGTTQRETLVYGTIDPDTRRVFLRESGGEQLKLTGAMSSGGELLTGTYTREGQRRPLAWKVTRAP